LIWQNDALACGERSMRPWTAQGASLAEIRKATDWQAHSVRGFISTAVKKHGLKIESTKTEGGEGGYLIKQ
jgi:hypothetical protein